MAKMQITDNSKSSEVVKQKLLLVGYKMVQSLGEHLVVSYKSKPILTYYHTSWYLLKEIENLCLHKMCIFIEISFITAQTWNKSNS